MVANAASEAMMMRHCVTRPRLEQDWTAVVGGLWEASRAAVVAAAGLVVKTGSLGTGRMKIPAELLEAVMESDVVGDSDLGLDLVVSGGFDEEFGVWASDTGCGSSALVVAVSGFVTGQDVGSDADAASKANVDSGVDTAAVAKESAEDIDSMRLVAAGVVILVEVVASAMSDVGVWWEGVALAADVTTGRQLLAVVLTFEP